MPSPKEQDLDPRFRIVVAFAFALLICACQRPNSLALAAAMALIAIVAAKPKPGRLIRILLGLNLFMAFLVLTLPLSTPGDPAFALGPLQWSRRGLLKAGLIALRANIILIAVNGLIGGISPEKLGFALCRLGIPPKLAHIFFFTVRYIETIGREYRRLQNAMRLRGFRPRCNRHTFRALGYLAGALLAHSLDRSGRVLEAMKCRGFRGRFHLLTPLRSAGREIIFAAAAVSALTAVAWLEWANVILANVAK